MWWTRTSCSIPSVKRISTTPSTRDRSKFIVIGSWTPSWTAYRMKPRFVFARDGLELKMQRLRPRPDLIRMEVQGHEDDALPLPQIVPDSFHQILELPDAWRTAQQNRIIGREPVLHLGHLGRSFRSGVRRRRLIHWTARCSVLSYIGNVVVLKAEKSRHRERIGRGPTKTYNARAPCGADASRCGGVELPREEGPLGAWQASESVARGASGRGQIPRARRGHERRLVASGQRARDYERTGRALVPTRAARGREAPAAGAEGAEGRNQGGRSDRSGPAQGRLQVW